MSPLLTEDIRFSVAPMMDWTDRHCRFFHRAAVAPGAALHRDGDDRRGDPRRPRDGCSASTRRSIRSRCSSAGRSRRELAAAARIGADLGYDEINLNVGCPSDRVQDGRFGACLMREPELVGDCVAAMKAAVDVARHGEVPHRRRRAGSGGGPRPAGRVRSRRPAPTRSSSMPARPGSRACRRRRTATCRRSTTAASTA